MGNAISLGNKPTQAEMTAAKFNRDFYVVFLKHTSGAYVPETSIQSSTMEQLVSDILEMQLDMPGSIESIAHFNPVAKTSRLVEAEVAQAVAKRTRDDEATPEHEEIIEWLEAFKCDFYESPEYLNARSQAAADDYGDYLYERKRDRQIDYPYIAA